MSRCLYLKMAVDNIRKNRQVYIPFLLTSIGTCAMYYILYALSVSDSIQESFGGAAVLSVLMLGRWIMMVFSVIFLYYTYSFLLKQRKKEFGIYTILGMEKRHIRRVLFWENLLAFLISCAGGILLGILLFKAVLLLLMRILHYGVAFGFEIPMEALQGSVLLLAVIFFLIFLNTIRIVHFTNPIDMLKGGQVGEREPKTKWVLALAGFLLLGGGYYLAITSKTPIEAFLMFFVAVVMVILGTYALFTAGSILILKLLRKNKNYYYKTSHFTSVSGMIYRMKQNAAGLASICVMSTAVLILISTTVSMYFGMNDLLRTRYPRDIMINAYPITEEELPALQEKLQGTIEESGVTVENTLSYLELGTMFYQTEPNHFDGQQVISFQGMNCQIFFLTLSDYNQMTGKEETLQEGEVLLQETRGEVLGDSLEIEDHTYRIKERINDFDMGNSELANMVNTFYVVLPDLSELVALETEFGSKGYEMNQEPGLEYCLNFDLDADDEEMSALSAALNDIVAQEGYHGYSECVADSKESFYALYGSMFFIGAFLGALFLMATVLIIYYKQLSEGYDDRERFAIMQKVGMSKREVRKSIKSQVMIVFFLPLAMAAVHICFAFPILTNIMNMMNLTNVRLFAVGMAGTFLAFALIYAAVYGMTAKAYYRIVSWKK